MSKQPRPYQIENATVIKAGNSLIIDDPGLGKTISAIEGVRPPGVVLPPQWRCLVIAPLRVGPQWEAEIHSQYPNDPVYLSGQDTFFLRRPGWTITHYEAVRTILEKDGRTHKNVAAWDVVIVDEAHRISNRKALQTKAINKLAARKKVALTGTPMEKSPAEMWSILHWLYPRIFTSYWSFFNFYVVSEPQFHGRGHKVIGVQNEDKLAQLVSPFVRRHTKLDVAADLPNKIVIPTRVAMLDIQHEVYQKIKHADDIVVESGPDLPPLIITNALTKITRLQQVTSYPAMLGVRSGSAKVEWTLEWLEDHPDEIVVIFTRFRATAEFIHSRVPNSALLMGGTDEVPVAWLNKEKRVLIGTIDAMGEGLNLQQASTAIFVDQEWSTIKMGQAYDRIHRLGITEPKIIYLLYCAGTVDSLIVEALTNKWSITEFVYAALRHFKNGT